MYYNVNKLGGTIASDNTIEIDKIIDEAMLVELVRQSTNGSVILPGDAAGRLVRSLYLGTKERYWATGLNILVSIIGSLSTERGVFRCAEVIITGDDFQNSIKIHPEAVGMKASTTFRF